MPLNNGQAQAANILAHYLDSTPAADGKLVTADQATEALAVLLDGANKQLHAGLRGEDAAVVIAALEQLREDMATYWLTDAGHDALAQPEVSDAPTA